ncbi:MAG: hypothetical protein KatS3mg093_425 [Candidatus Parcubacteria bacterium]|nr:MAG: hypothetical protein KatS3mg093_425 [Candidatus Parcubacteria bacterium]
MYPVHVCTHCETAVAYNEIEYIKQDDPSIYVKFKIKGSNNKYLIIWTTTPWTLPSNTGIMAHPHFDYVELAVNNEIWILAKARLDDLFKKINLNYKLIREFKGKELEGINYENPLSRYLNLPELKNAYRVVLNERYVNLEEGTGLVHTAPGCGKEDHEVGKINNLPILSIISISGLFEKEAGKYAGKKARVVDSEIIEDLKKEGALVHYSSYNHDYPICWRCKSPLIMISIPQWFFSIEKIKESLLKHNEEVNWVPGYMKQRMKAWLEGISDWPISRNRYWGAPLPIWVCEKCNKKEVIGSIKELEKKSKVKITEVHKPEIDKVKWKCSCGGIMKRVPEVLDVWFDSGVSSWAALGYPKNKKLFKKFWPADLNIEGRDQFRGWWNSQLILSKIKFNKKPYLNIVVHGMVLALGKIKMSKSLGNFVSPSEIIEKYGRDVLRYYFAKTSKGEDFSVFDENEFKKSIYNVFRVLVNVNNYVNQLYKLKNKTAKKVRKNEIEDLWILSKFNTFLEDVKGDFDRFVFHEAIQKIEKFLIEDLSKTYIKIIREREEEVFDILNKIRKDLLVVLSPIIPFLTEEMWQDLKKKKIVKEESVHLSYWPKSDKKKINKKLEKEFEEILKIIEAGLAERDKIKIGLRWPLLSVEIIYKKKFSKKFEEILMRQLNVKNVVFHIGDSLKVNYDIKITKDLEAEGYAREISRNIQEFRKKLGLEKSNKIETYIIADEDFIKLLKMKENFIKERTNSLKLEFLNEDKETFKNKVDFKIKEKRGKIAIIIK